MRIGVTGGKGFIGRRIIEALRTRGHEVVALSRGPTENRDGVSFFSGDLADPQSPLAQFVRGLDAVIHCAGEIKDTTKMRSLHVDGTARLLDAVRAEHTRTGNALRWVQLSSVGAYGPPPRYGVDRVVTEETPTNPTGDYEVTKTLSDELVLAAAETGSIAATIVRPSAVIGAEMPNDSVRALGRAVKRGVFAFVGRPGAIANYVHVDDVAALLALCASDARAGGETFNLSNDCTIETLVAAIAAAVNAAVPTKRFPSAPLRAIAGGLERIGSFPITRSRIDALTNRTRYPYTKAERVLGFAPRKSVPEVIGEAVAELSQR